MEQLEDSQDTDAQQAPSQSMVTEGTHSEKVTFWRSWYFVATLISLDLFLFYFSTFAGFSVEVIQILQFVAVLFDLIAFIRALQMFFDLKPKIIFNNISLSIIYLAFSIFGIAGSQSVPNSAFKAKLALLRLLSCISDP